MKTTNKKIALATTLSIFTTAAVVGTATYFTTAIVGNANKVHVYDEIIVKSNLFKSSNFNDLQKENLRKSWNFWVVRDSEQYNIIFNNWNKTPLLGK